MSVNRTTLTESNYLFVYGTLLKAVKHRMHQYLVTHTDYVGKGTFQGRLYEVSHYPGAVASEVATDKVTGEVYFIKDKNILTILDRYEGCLDSENKSSEFIRTIVPIKMENGTLVETFIYLYNLSPESLRFISAGDYLEYISSAFKRNTKFFQ